MLMTMMMTMMTILRKPRVPFSSGKLYFHRLSSALQVDLEAILVFNITQQLFQLYEYLHSEE